MSTARSCNSSLETTTKINTKDGIRWKVLHRDGVGHGHREGGRGGAAQEGRQVRPRRHQLEGKFRLQDFIRMELWHNFRATGIAIKSGTIFCNLLIRNIV